ncbi:MAG TPA: CIA30 family protein [Candidatus Caenarcaniphilales bacterium]
MKRQTGVVLVAGATNGLGKHVVSQLLAQNYQVRALVADMKIEQWPTVDRGPSLLGDKLELVTGDLTKPETLTTAVAENLTAVICCAAVDVQPLGDTLKRGKDIQGVPFSQLEALTNTPGTVEYLSVKNLVVAAAQVLRQTAKEQLIFDFTGGTADLKSTWGAVDDVVMGGISASGIRLGENAALFAGEVSTANSGGFASVRTRNFDSPLSLAAFDGIELRVKGDGKRYKFILRTEAKWDGVAYCYSFDTLAKEWISVRIPFSDLIPVFRAKTIEAAPFDPNHLCSFQLMLSKFEYDQALNPNFKPGPFQLEVASIKAYRDEVLPQFVLVSSAGVTGPSRPGLNGDEEPPAAQMPAAQMNEQLGSLLTWQLKAEDSVRASGVPYTIIKPCRLTEAQSHPLTFAQGGTPEGTISCKAVAEICVQALEQAKACNTTFELVTHAGTTPRAWEELFASLQADKPGPV